MNTINNNYEITLNSGRNIILEELHQHLTYLGLLEGLPTKRINKDIISELKETANDKIWSSTKPYIIKPEERIIELPDNRKEYYKLRGEEYIPVSLPKIISIGHFISGPISDEFMFSNLTIIWFNEEWFDPINNKILKKIKSINWDKYSIQGDF